MAKTLVDIDDEALAAAKAALGTSTKVETVNAALREVVNVRRRLHLFTALADSDIDDDEVMGGAWR